MSYILEALKKSELARQQGAAALHYSLLPVVMEEDMAPSRRWPYYVLGAGLMLNAAAFYVWPSWSAHLSARSESATQPSITPPQVAQVPPTSKTDTPVAAVTAEPPPVTRPSIPEEIIAPRVPPKLASEAPLDASRPLLSAASAKPDRKPARKEPELLSSAPAEPAPSAGVKRATKAAVVQDSKPAPVTNAEVSKRDVGAPPAPMVSPSQLPSLSVGGFIREDGSSGMVVVNDRLVREGDEVMPGLTVEKIQNESVVFNYKGQRFVR
jgi:general secretion pathway protein B